MSCIVRLQSFPSTANSDDVRQLFVGLNIPDGGVYIVGGSKGYVFVSFATVQDACTAMKRKKRCVRGHCLELAVSSQQEKLMAISEANAEERTVDNSGLSWLSDELDARGSEMDEDEQCFSASPLTSGADMSTGVNGVNGSLSGSSAFQNERQDDQKVYVEITDVPPCLWRPIALENFFQPSISFKFSAVKVFFGQLGRVLVGFECVNDVESALKKSGLYGIKIHRCARKEFNAAQDCSIRVPVTAFQCGDYGTYSTRRLPTKPSPSLHTIVMADGENGVRQSEISANEDRTEDELKQPAVDAQCEDLDERCFVELSNLPRRVTHNELRWFLGRNVGTLKMGRVEMEGDGESERWVIEFPSENCVRKMCRMHGYIHGRHVRVKRISENEADALLDSTPSDHNLR